MKTELSILAAEVAAFPEGTFYETVCHVGEVLLYGKYSPTKVVSALGMYYQPEIDYSMGYVKLERVTEFVCSKNQKPVKVIITLN